MIIISMKMTATTAISTTATKASSVHVDKEINDDAHDHYFNENDSDDSYFNNEENNDDSYHYFNENDSATII
jgi:hypothetical protein